MKRSGGAFKVKNGVANTLYSQALGVVEMAQGRAKQHHFLPQGLQRHFCNQKGQLWYSEKKADGHFTEPEARNTRSTFKRRDYYTVLEKGLLSDKVETGFYAPIDDYLANFIAQVHSAFDAGSVPIIKGDALTSIRKVIYHLVVRTPHFADRYDDYEIGLGVLDGVMADAKQANLSSADISALEDEFLSEAFIRNVGRSVRVRGQAAPSEEIDAELETFSLRFAISKSKHSFVLSSQTAYRIGNGGRNGMSNPDMEVWLPISPKRALIMMRDPNGVVPLVVNEPRDHIRQVNEYAVRNSDQVGSHSKKLLLSLFR